MRRELGILIKKWYVGFYDAIDWKNKIEGNDWNSTFLYFVSKCVKIMAHNLSLAIYKIYSVFEEYSFSVNENNLPHLHR